MSLIIRGKGDAQDPNAYGQQNSEPEKAPKKSSTFGFLKSSSKSDTSKTNTTKQTVTRSVSTKPTKEHLTEKEFNANVQQAKIYYAQAAKHEASAAEHGKKIEQLQKQIDEIDQAKQEVKENIKIVSEAEARLARIQAIKQKAIENRANQQNQNNPK